MWTLIVSMASLSVYQAYLKCANILPIVILASPFSPLIPILCGSL